MILNPVPVKDGALLWSVYGNKAKCPVRSTSTGIELSLFGGEARAFFELSSEQMMMARKIGINLKRIQAPNASRQRLQLTPRDLAILDALTQRVKALSVFQVAQWFWDEFTDESAAARRLGQLVRAGMLDAIRLMVGLQIDVVAPLTAWRPGESTPIWTPLLKVTRGRWIGPMESVRCFIATPCAAARFGCNARPPRISDGTHDLVLGQVFLRLRNKDPRLAARWVGEAQQQRQQNGRAIKVPDAIIHCAGRPMAIEVVGASYGAQKLDAFHAFCKAEDLAYELW